MHKQKQPQWLGAIAIAFLSLPFPILFAEAALANPRSTISVKQQTEAQEINRLIEQLKTDDELEWHNTIEKLAARGKSALPYLIASVSHPDMRVRFGTILVLREGYLRGLALVSLSQKLGNSQQDVKVRRYISQALLLVLLDRYFSEEQDWSSAIPALTSALQDSDAFVRSSAASALGSMGTEAKSAIPALISTLKDSDAWVRSSAASALGSMGTEAKSAIPALISALKDSDAWVRSSAASALGEMGAEAKSAIPALISALKDSDAWVRRSAASALGEMGAEAKSAIPALISALKDSDALVRRSAASALGSRGTEAKSVIPALTSALKDSDALVRRSAAYALGEMGVKAKSAIPALTSALQDPDEWVRSSAASALGSIGTEAKSATPALISALKDSDALVRRSAASALGSRSTEAKSVTPALISALKDSDTSVRSSAARALGNMSVEAKSVIPALISALKDSDTSVRSSAASALGEMGAEAKSAIPALISALKDSDAWVRSSAADALGEMGAEAKSAIPALISALQDRDGGLGSAANALGSIASSLEKNANQLTNQELDKVIQELDLALKIAEDLKNEFSIDRIDRLRYPLNVLKEIKRDRLFKQAILQNPWAWGGILYLIILPSFWLLVLRVRPLWIWQLNNNLKTVDIPVKAFNANFTISARSVLLVKLFAYRPRVLDAWVAQYLQTTRQQFKRKDTVREREIYVPNIPVKLNNQTLNNLTPQDLQTSFNHKRDCLLIYGEGGSGKTSLACQIAHWAMNGELYKHPLLPVLIEQDLDFSGVPEKQPLIEAIRGQLQDLIDEAESISPELLEQLLRKQRILVIVDHLSELNEQTRKEIKPGYPDFPINALVVTSRFPEHLNQVTKTTLNPLRLKGSELSHFMQTYLEEKGEYQRFSGHPFHEACGQLERIVGNREITVLLAKLYADSLIANQSVTRLHNIPELMLAYLNQLNQNVTEEPLSDRAIHQDAKIVAWECLKHTYQPKTAKIEDVLIALGGTDPDIRLKYLETRLHLIQTIGSAKDQIRFSLDPLAEYLAGLYLTDLYGNHSQSWSQFIVDAEQNPGSSTTIQGFLLAVRECYLAKIPGATETDLVPEDLYHLATSGSVPNPPQATPVS